MVDGKNSQASTVAAAAGAAPAAETKVELTLSSVTDISAQIDLMRRNGDTGPGALSKRKGLKTTAALDGMSNPLLLLLAAASLRQIAVNCGEDSKEFNKQFKLLTDYSKVLPAEILNEIKLDKFAGFAEEYNVVRAEGESADSFIDRIKDAIVKSRK